MLESYVCSNVLRERLENSFLAPHLNQFTKWQCEQGFKPLTITCDLRSLAGWADWMKDHRFTKTEDFVLGFESCKEELKSRGRIFYSRGANKHSIRAAKKYIQFLRTIGILTALPKKLSVSETWPMLADFRSWSIEHRGLQETTLDLYDTCLRDLMKDLGVDPEKYTAKSIRNFVLNRAKPHTVWRAQGITVAMRSFLRFLAATGKCSPALIDSVPKYRNYGLQGLPRYLEPKEMEKVISFCHDRDENGLRDRAVILLLARLGLRASDVANLKFSNIDWANGRLAICGKNRTPEWLPLPQEVGEAILKYIRKGRSKFKTENIFIKVDAPIGPLTRASVTHIARSALLRAGIKAPINGAHVFRHSAATAMLRKGVSLAGIGSVLRHRSPDTTAIYAKVDLGLLKDVAQPWPTSEVAPC
jgi:integrase/recombinase XerD